VSDTGFITGRTTRRSLTRSSGKKGLDGRIYPEDVEHELNILAARVLGTPDGIRFTNYLRGITMNVAFLGDVDPHELMHMEGQRWLVGLMLSRVRAGNNPS
jgi:hypothetical protein